MLKTVLAAVAAVTTAVQTAHAQPKWAQGQTYSGNIDIGGVQVPLPSGNWVVTGVENSVINMWGSGAETSIGLAQISDGKLRAYAWISYNQQALINGSGWRLDAEKNCARTEIHYAAVVRNRQVDKSCTYVNHNVFDISSTSPKWWKDSVAYAKTNSIGIPLAVIQSGIVVSDRQNFVSVGYYFNPEIQGFAPPKNTVWQTSDWSVLNTASDEQKKAFVKSIIDWTEKTRPAVEAGLAGRLKKGESLDWPVAMQ
jgi:hypothetical protein